MLLSRPSVPTSPATWNDPTQLARVIPKGWMPAQANQVPIVSWTAAPADQPGWTALAQADPVPEPAWPRAPGEAASVGTAILEADGRIWLVAPSNAMGGSATALPKAALVEGWSAQAAALQAGHLAAGLQLRLVRHLIDVSGGAGPTRFYLAERVGGNPADMGWTSQAVLLAPLIALSELLEDPRDLAVVEALLARS